MATPPHIGTLLKTDHPENGYEANKALLDAENQNLKAGEIKDSLQRQEEKTPVDKTETTAKSDTKTEESGKSTNTSTETSKNTKAATVEKTEKQSKKNQTDDSESKKVSIGNGRYLLKWIPGTNGKEGKALANKCSGSGSVTFSYTVSKEGWVTSVKRSSGSSNTCMVNSGINWIKNYVKADKGKSSATATYKINF